MSWARLKRVMAPAAPPVSIDEIKRHLRIDTDDENADLQTMLDAALASIEGPYGRGLALISQTWRMSAETFPAYDLVVPLWPVLSIDSLTYVDAAGVAQTLTGYQVDLDANPAVLRPAWGSFWPQTRGDLAGVKVTFRAGFGADASAVPADLRRYLLLTIGHLYRNREATSAEALQAIPEGVRAIVDRYAVGTIA